MNYFLNYKNGSVRINTYRYVDATVTDVDDIVRAYESESNETLTASIDIFIKEKCTDLENDVLEKTIENKLGFDLYDYPELRDIQIDAARLKRE